MMPAVFLMLAQWRLTCSLRALKGVYVVAAEEEDLEDDDDSESSPGRPVLVILEPNWL